MRLLKNVKFSQEKLREINNMKLKQENQQFIQFLHFYEISLMN